MIGGRCGVSENTVRAWRASFAERGVAGVGVIAQGRGRRPWLPEGTVAEVVRVTLTERPADSSTHWSTRTLAKRMGISHGAVAGNSVPVLLATYARCISGHDAGLKKRIEAALSTDADTAAKAGQDADRTAS